MPEPARVAIDLGAESCRVSLLRFVAGEPHIELVQRIANGPVRRGDSLVWPLESLLAGLEEGLGKAAAAAPEGVASIGVDGWSVDYVRLAPDGTMQREPFCYRDERTTASKQAADGLVPPLELYQRTGALPLRINTVYQLLADRASGIDPLTPWVMLPEYVLYRLSGRRVAEYSNASHTGLVNLKTREWDAEVLRELGLAVEAAPPLVGAGAILGPLQGALASLKSFRHTQVIAPATHDTASAVAGIPAHPGSVSYLCTGTWSLMGTLSSKPVITPEALEAGYTNLGAATEGLCLHTLINGMWLLKQCMDGWAAQGRGWTIDALVQGAADCGAAGGRSVDVNAEPLMLEGSMPERINRELVEHGHAAIADIAGNEPLFARLVFESLAEKYARSLASLERMLGRKLEGIHMLGGANRNKLLVRLTAERTGRPVTIGATESSTIGNLAVQLAASEAGGQPITGAQVRRWASHLCTAAT